MKAIILVYLLQLGFISLGQINLNDIKPDEAFENISIKEISKDSLQSNFVIWIKHAVPAHYHENHTESIYVISGKGEMTIGSKTLNIRTGDFIVIPAKTVHSVTKVKGNKPLKVLSNQAPMFDGSDRFFVKP